MPRMHFAGPGEYDDVVMEIDFSPAFTVVVSRKEGRYAIEAFNCSQSQLEDFAQGRRRKSNAVDLDEFLQLVSEARAALQYQQRR